MKFLWLTRTQLERSPWLRELPAHYRLCRREISTRWLQASLRQADWLVLAIDQRPSSSPKVGGTIRGLAHLQNQGTQLQIDLLCGQGTGQQLMHHIEAWARQQQYQRLTLFSLPHVINFYRKLGFRFGCHEAAALRRRAEQSQSLRFASPRAWHQAARDPRMRPLLEALAAQQSHCHGRMNCSAHGFEMTKCLE